MTFSDVVLTNLDDEVPAVPLPASFGFLGTGLAALGLTRRRKAVAG